MLIECTLKREEPIVIPIGNEKYTFEDDGSGRRVAEVWIESHVESFLAVPHLYREVDDDPAEATSPHAPAARTPARGKKR